MNEKKHIVRLTDSEHKICTEVIGKRKGTRQEIRRAQILLKADADGPAWTDAQIAEAFSCRTKTVEDIRERFVELGFEQTLGRNGNTVLPNVPKKGIQKCFFESAIDQS